MSRELTASEIAFARFLQLQECGGESHQTEEEMKCIVDNLRELFENNLARPVNDATDDTPAFPSWAAKDANGKLGMYIDYSPLESLLAPSQDDSKIPTEAELNEFVERSQSEGMYVSRFVFKTYSIAYPIPLDSNSIPNTVFRAGGGVFEFTVLPFDMPRSWEHMHRIVENTVGRAAGIADDSRIMVRITEAVITSTSFETHLDDLRKVLAACKKVNLALDASRSGLTTKKITPERAESSVYDE
eukprot:TRINITY_DN5537_c0_g1_i1.p1 TRINITY_DN5537_c0_g1~~TRINITY_DN5537_c0_g1_i1.p1  ORF type:complete len:244 (-),score=54.61 TRINITY_DN5537_c0_g1_i1:28-759(-)